MGAIAEKDLAYYLGLPYTFTLIPDKEEGGFVIKVNELPGCVSQGDSAEEAATRIKEAMEAWIEAALRHADPIPEPTDDFSGKFNVRVPKSVHKAVSEAAAREGVSLNLFVATTLAKAVGEK